jgi:hypothetical protein
MKNYNHALLVMEKHDYPAEAREVIIRAEEKILADEKANKIYEAMYRAYWLKKRNFGDFGDKVEALADLIGEHKYTVNFVLLINCTKPLLAKYRKEKIDEEIYWRSILDLKSKLIECKENYDVWGTFVEGWFKGFYEMNRFALGRLQFENSDFCCDMYKEHGVELYDSDFVVGMHIPSNQGPLTYEARLDSYRQAYKFFKHKFKDPRYGIFCCHSWLLFPDNLDILPEKSNISDFLLDFQPLEIKWTYDFGDQWRVFGVKNDRAPLDELPQNTSMQRAYVNWFKQGKKCGTAYGIVIYDSETDTLLTRLTREEYKARLGYGY